MNLLIAKKNDVYLIDVMRNLDLFNANKLKELILKMIEKKCEKFILNMHKVKSLNSSGIGALIYISSTIKKMNLSMAIINVNHGVQEAFQITKLGNYFPVSSSLHAAMEKLEQTTLNR
ncbi:STAS domain-containing protein [Breznakiellaceae bacterium SP9]